MAISVSSDCPDMLFRLSHRAAVSSPGAVSRAGEDLAVTEETAAGQVAWPSRETLLYVRSPPVRNPLPLPRSLTCVRCQLTHDLHVPVLAFQIVDGAHVVQAATGHQVP